MPQSESPPTAPGVPPPQASAPTPVAAPPAAPPPAAAPPVIVFRTVPPPVAAADPTARRHDGFYLRLGLGAGFMRSVVDFEDVNGTSEVKVRGGGVGFELALGGTVAPGLVIGGGIYTVSASEITWESDAQSVLDRYDDDTFKGGDGVVGMLGVMLDFYPNPRGGFHVQGGIGLGTLALDHDKDTGFPGENWEGGGGGLMLGAGYEFWVSDQWSLGGVGRVLMVSGKVRGSESDRDYDAKAIAPALLFVATHH